MEKCEVEAILGDEVHRDVELGKTKARVTEKKRN